MRSTAEEYKITKGSKYSVTFRLNAQEHRTLNGTYKGLSTIGSETALVLDCEGTVSFVVASNVIQMDLLEAAPPEPETKKPEPSSVYYG